MATLRNITPVLHVSSGGGLHWTVILETISSGFNTSLKSSPAFDPTASITPIYLMTSSVREEILVYPLQVA